MPAPNAGRYSPLVSESLCPAPLSRQACLLVLSGLGRQKRLWALDRLERSPLYSLQAISDAAAGPSVLCALAASILRLALLATLGQAKAAFHIRWCRIQKPFRCRQSQR